MEHLDPRCTITDVKSSPNVFNSRMDMIDERVTELENRSIEMV